MPESSDFKMFWTPAFAGVTVIDTFYEFIKSACFAIGHFSLSSATNCLSCAVISLDKGKRNRT